MARASHKRLYIAVLVFVLVVVCAVITYKTVSIQGFNTGSAIVELYDRVGFCGQKQAYTAEGEYSLTGGITPSSARVAAGYQVTAYLNADKSGEFITLQGDKTDLAPEKGNRWLGVIDNAIKVIVIKKIDPATASGALTLAPACPYADRNYIPLQREQIQTSQGSPLYVPYSFNFNGPVRYTLSMDIYIANLQGGWRNIVYYGAHDNWGVTWGGDRTPGLWTHPWGTTLHFRQRSDSDANFGCDVPAPGMGRWFNFTAVVDTNTITIYIDYVQVSRCVGSRFNWGIKTGKRFHVGLGENGYRLPGTYIRNVYFVPEVMNNPEQLRYFFASA